ncbi:MAG: MBL fold metallo-hydrolase [Gemmatimonadota bacterium]|nr:MAG: MBL fold metallo-hydrolase [Gemmatimonadota bacterium]
MKLEVQGVAALAVLCLASVAGPEARAQNWEDVEIESVELAPGVHMLTGRGGNLGLSAGEDGVFLIDDQYAPLTEKIVAAIRSISDAPIRFVINTHWHGDHVGGNENLGKAGTLILAHDNVRARMSVEQFMAAFDRIVPPSPEAALPVVTFSESVTFHLNGYELRAFHVENAHTDGDAIIRFRGANVVHMGDVYWSSAYPFIDYSAGGSIDGVIAAVQRVLATVDDDTKIIPGHGPLSNKAELGEYLGMLVGVRDAIVAEIAEGRSVEEVIAASPTAEWDEEWGEGYLNPETFTRIVYAGLTWSK